MSVYPERRKGRLTGKWIAEAPLAGERLRKRFETKHEGERWADHIKLTGAPPQAAGDNVVTFGQVAAEMRATKPRWVRGRDKTGQRRLEFAVDAIGAETDIATVNEAMLNKLVANLAKRPGRDGKLSDGTINRYLSAISAVLNFAAHKSRAYIPFAPAVPWRKETGKRIHWLTEEQETVLLKSMGDKGQHTTCLVLRVLTATGLRWGELVAVSKAPEAIQGEWIKLDQSKTDTPRDVPIDPELGRELVALINGKAFPSYYTFRKQLQDAVKSAGLNPKLCIHALRHSTATRLVHKDVNLAVVKDYLGHKAIATTLKYTHVSAPALQEASKKISPRAG